MAQHGQTQSGPSPSRLLTTTTTTTTTSLTETAATATGVGSHGSNCSSRTLLLTAANAANAAGAADSGTGLGPAPPPRPPTSSTSVAGRGIPVNHHFNLTAPRIPARPPGQARATHPNPLLLPLPPRASVRLSSESSLPVVAISDFVSSGSPSSASQRQSPLPRAQSTPLTFPSRSPSTVPGSGSSSSSAASTLHHVHLHSHILHTHTAAPPAQVTELISLTQPRPDGERARNEYIDTPLKGGLNNRGGGSAAHKPATGSADRSRLASHSLHAHTHVHVSGAPHAHLALVSTSTTGSNNNNSSTSSGLTTPALTHPKRLATASPALKRSLSTRRSGGQKHNATLPSPVTQQPGSLTFTKDAAALHSDAAHHTAASAALVTCTHSECSGVTTTKPGRDSIICPVCGRCRCEACRTPKPLPSRWLCNDKCLCSAEACLDYVSCLCCVKGLFYHCSSTDDGGSCADRPCSCGPSKYWTRWACLASLSIVLPCLACYWPLKGCARLTEMCYQRCTQHGCRCEEAASSANTTTLSPTTAVSATAGRHCSNPGLSSSRIPSSLPGPSDKRLLDNE